MTQQPRDRKSGAIEATRVTIEREVDLRFPHFQGFVTEVSANLSMSGMFVCSDNPQPVGTVFSFRFRIEDWKLIQGTGRVIWIRGAAEGPDRPPGMGVHFVELDAQSRRMVRWLVERHLHQGGKPFELGSGESEPSADEEEPPAPFESPAAGRPERAARPEAPPPWRRQSAAWRELRRRRRRNRKLLWGSALLLAVALAALAAWRLGLPSSTGRAGLPFRPPPRSSAAAGSVDSENRAEATPEPSRAELEAEIAEVVQGWAAAWSEQRVTDYLAFYSSDFSPQRNMSRDQWRAWRRERVAAPAFIRVAITALEISMEEDGLAEAGFFQTYRSDAFTDTVRKTLTLVREEGEWKIARELIAPG